MKEFAVDPYGSDLGGTRRGEVRIPHVPRGHVLHRVRRPDGTWEERLQRRRTVEELRADLESRRRVPRGRAFGFLPGPREHRHRYAWVPSSSVPELVREVVMAEVAIARSRCARRGEDVEVRWFAPAEVGASFSWASEISGLNDRSADAIAVRTDLDAETAARTARHELAHLEGASEEDARRAEVW